MYELCIAEIKTFSTICMYVCTMYYRDRFIFQCVHTLYLFVCIYACIHVSRGVKTEMSEWSAW